MEALNLQIIHVLNHLIEGESWAQTRLAPHAGAQVHIETGVFVIRLGIAGSGYFVTGDRSLQPDVTIALPSDFPVRLLFDSDAVFSSVKLGGSADIAESFAFVLRNLRWDFEHDLAQFVGDIPARRIARLAYAMAGAIQDTISRVAANFSDYATEDSGVLVTKQCVDGFDHAVIALRDDMARLEKRISRL